MLEVEHLTVELNGEDEEQDDEKFLDPNATHVDMDSSHCGLGCLSGPSHAATNELDDKGNEI